MGVYATLQEYVRTHGVELAGRSLAAALILLAAYVLARLAHTAVGAAIRARSEERRSATLVPITQSLTRISILSVAAVMALSQLGVNVTTVLAGAGVLGLAVGFGAQTLVRDVISGFFLIFDGVIETGDHITFDGVSGTVEVVGLRLTQVRAIDGKLWYVPNGELKIIGNFNRSWARAIVNVPLAYEQNIATGLALIQEVADAWAEQNAEIVLEPPEAQGVLGLNASDIGVRVVVKVQALKHWAAERELTRMIKDAFDERGVEIPFPRQVVYHRGDPSARAT